MLNDDAEPTQDRHKSAGELFDDAPSWYEAPELSEDELNPDVVPPKHRRLGDTAGMGSLATPTRKIGMDPGRQTMLVWLGIFFVLGGGALLSLIFGIVGEGISGADTTSPQDLRIDDCFIAPGDPTAVEAPDGVEVVPCIEDHNAQVVGVVVLDANQIDDEQAYVTDVSVECLTALTRADPDRLPADAGLGFYLPEDIPRNGTSNLVCFYHSESGFQGSVTG